MHYVDSAETDHFLVQIEREGRLHAHATGTLSQVNELIGDQQSASIYGEEPDEVTVWHLGYGVPMLVSITMKRHVQIGFTEVSYRWSQVGGVSRDTCVDRSETAYFKLLDA